MGEFTELLLQHTITFFAILDPIGASALMLSLLQTEVSKKEISVIAYKVTLTILVAFFVVLIGGNFILQIFGIDSNSLKVMGGIVLIITALNMVRGSSESKALTKEENKDIKVQEDLSIIPIAIPITFGPGIFSTIIILREHANGTMLDIVAIILAFFINAVLVYLVFKNSIYIKQYLGLTGQNIITKLMGLIVGAIAVQFIISGAISLAQIYLK